MERRLEVLKLKRVIYREALYCARNCYSTVFVENVWADHVMYPELYEPGICLKQGCFDSYEKQEKWEAYKLRENKLNQVIKELDWKIQFIEFKPTKWYKRIYILLKHKFRKDKDSIELNLLKE